MNSNIKSLIRAIADDDIQKAKSFIKVIVTNDKAACNSGFNQMIINKLSSPMNNLIELPRSLEGMLTVEDVSISFDERRFVLAERDFPIVERVFNIWNTNEKLTEHGIHYLNSLLLHGESGCGKTTLGRYIAYKTGLSFAYLNFSHVISSYLGSTGKNISEAFNFISKKKYVFMIDEVDAIGMERGHEKEVGEMSRIVINLMQSLDKLDNGTIVIGATNRLDIIDKALLRRFSIKYCMGKPTRAMIKVMAKKYLSTIPEAFFDDKSLDLFAEKCSGWSYAEITNEIVDQIVWCFVRNLPVKLSA